LRGPGVVVLLGFASMVLLVALLLLLPAAHEDGITTSFRAALFTRHLSGLRDRPDRRRSP
jgi:hypothetical protein